MITSDYIRQTLKKRGYRFTAVRKALLDVLVQNHDPLSFVALQALLSKSGVKANKTTIYRELFTLEKEGFVQYVKLYDAVRRYELIPKTHHHHLVCLQCQKVRDVLLDKKLRAQEVRLIGARSRGFIIMGHSLEWYGICTQCSQAKR